MSRNKRKLQTHPLIQTVGENVLHLVEEIFPIEDSEPKLKELAKDGEVQSEYKNEVWEYYEGYETYVFLHLEAVVSCFNRLKQAQNFIRVFPQPSIYEREGVTQDTWIAYHYSYYLVNLVSLLDIALILTNTIFRLGNRERDCRQILIMNNTWVERTPVKQVLVDLEKLVKPHREGRNIYLHRGKSPDIGSKIQMEDYYLLRHYNPAEKISEPIVSQEFIDLLYQGCVEEIIEMLQNETDCLFDTLWQLFDALYPIYKNKSTELHQV